MSLAHSPETVPPASEITINGATLLADLSGALVWAERRALLVADLHLEKGSAYAAGGRLLPPYDTAATLTGLADAIARYDIESVYCLGDSFHDGEAGERLAAADLRTLKALTRRCAFTWIVGNHDQDPGGAWGGEVVDEAVLGPLVLRHEARPGQNRSAGEISGHFHPKAAVRVREKRLSRRCFVSDGRRLVLPAFGAYTGGLNVLDPAVAGLFPAGFTAHLIGARDLYAYPSEALLPYP